MLKLAKLPDRITTKITFSANAKLNEDLHGYAILYRNTYAETASVPELIPFMLEAFLESDHAFTKARRDGSLNTEGGKETSTKQSSRARNFHSGSSAASAANFQTTTQTKGD